MKAILAVSLFFLLIFACQKKEKPTETKQIVFQEKPIPLDTLGEWVKIVMNKQKDGILRGFELGTPLDTIKAKEKVKILEENPSQGYITYSFDIDEDMVDITYRYDENRKIKAFEVLAIVNGVESFIQDFTTYYNLRYGNAQQTNDTMQVWQSQKGYKIKLIKSNKTSQARILIE